MARTICIEFTDGECDIDNDHCHLMGIGDCYKLDKEHPEAAGEDSNSTPLLSGDYLTACFECGGVAGLVMMPHRNDGGRIVGWVFACEKCWLHLADKTLTVTAT